MSDKPTLMLSALPVGTEIRVWGRGAIGSSAGQGGMPFEYEGPYRGRDDMGRYVIGEHRTLPRWIHGWDYA